MHYVVTFQTRPFVNYFQIGNMPIQMNPVHHVCHWWTISQTSFTRKTRILPTAHHISCFNCHPVNTYDFAALNPKTLERLNAELIVVTVMPHSRVRLKKSKSAIL